MKQSSDAVGVVAAQILARQCLFDQQTVIIVGKVPKESVVYLQALFESYEGVGTVRTLDTEQSIVCVISSPTTAEDCRGIISSENAALGWEALEVGEELKRTLYEVLK